MILSICMFSGTVIERWLFLTRILKYFLDIITSLIFYKNAVISKGIGTWGGVLTLFLFFCVVEIFHSYKF